MNRDELLDYARRLATERAARPIQRVHWCPAQACPTCRREVHRDDWAVRDPSARLWHADCWHAERTGDLLDLLAVGAVS